MLRRASDINVLLETGSCVALMKVRQLHAVTGPQAECRTLQ